jgi:C-terminal domain of 1-Cys peroxiredoxin
MSVENVEVMRTALVAFRSRRCASDIEETQGQASNYPLIGDADFNVSKLYGMLPATTEGDPLERTPADNQTVRNVVVIGPDKKVKLILVYPMTTGRSLDEVLRVIDSLQLTAKHKVATPVNWQQGEDVIIAGSVSDDEAKETYPQGWKARRPYIRIVPAALIGAIRAPCLRSRRTARAPRRARQVGAQFRRRRRARRRRCSDARPPPRRARSARDPAWPPTG